MLLLWIVSMAWAWGPLAHERIADVAETRLTPEALTEVRRIHPEPLATLANSPDTWRAERPETRPLHYINVPLEATHYVATRDCPEGRCAAAALAHYAHRLADTTLSDEDRVEALAMVVHLVGDLHQPLHVAYPHDRGGNQHEVRFRGQSTDLHTFWDDVVPGLAPQRATPMPALGNPQVWSDESLELTRSAVYVAPGAALSDTYLEEAGRIGAERIDQAGWRLAGLLDSVLVNGEVPVDPRPQGYAQPTSYGNAWWLLIFAGLCTGAMLVLRMLLVRSAFRVFWRGRPIAVLVVGAVAAVAFDACIPLLYRHAVDVVIPARAVDGIVWVFAYSLGLWILGVLGYIVMGMAGAQLATEVTAAMRERILRALPSLPQDELEAFGLGAVWSRLQSDLEQLERFAGKALPNLMRSGLSFILGIGVMVDLDRRLALWMALGIAVLAVLPRKFANWARASRGRRLEAEEDLMEGLQDFWHGQSVLRVLGRAFEWAGRVAERGRGIDRARRREVFLNSLVPATGALGALALSIIIFADGAYRVVLGELSVGGLTGAFAGMMVIASGLTRGMSGLPAIAAARSALDRLAELTDRAKAVPQRETVEALAQFEVDGLCFSHDGQDLHLDHVNFSLAAGRSVAIVGPSGSGKSTLLSTLVRRTHASGRVQWNGDVLAEDHLARIAVVPQSPYMFALSLRENIRLGHGDASDAEVERAGSQACLDALIARLPDGWDTRLGPEGTRLSGGEAQRVAIARALIRDPDLLLLDEATSALDPRTSAEVESVLCGLSCTRIAVTHDLEFAQQYDEILVMDAGAVVASGTHETLLETSELYRTLRLYQDGIEVDGATASVHPDRLARVAAFVDWPRAAVEALARASVTEEYADGAVITSHGDPGDRMFLVAHGRVSVRIPRIGAAPFEISRCGPGDCLGEIALVTSRRRTATLIAEGAVVLLSFHREDVVPILEAHPEARTALEAIARQRLAGQRGSLQPRYED